MHNKLKILIVEDEFTSMWLLREMLEPYGECFTTSSGAEALGLIIDSYNSTGKRFDLVCLDIGLPELSGHEILVRIRNIEKVKNIHPIDSVKVMMITGFGDAENIFRATVEGRCQSYVTKPVSRERLESELSFLRLIDRPLGLQPETIQ